MIIYSDLTENDQILIYNKIDEYKVVYLSNIYRYYEKENPEFFRFGDEFLQILRSS
jgi:hypothetical protein